MDGIEIIKIIVNKCLKSNFKIDSVIFLNKFGKFTE